MQHETTAPTIEAIGPSEVARPERISLQWRIWLACALVAMANQADPPLWLLTASMPQASFGADWVRYWNIAST
jgi:hypothetical protein